MTKKIPLSAINIDADTQMRVEIDEDTVADYEEAICAGVTLPPLDVFHDGLKYYLADGFHRYFAHMRCKSALVPVTYHEGTVTDARWFAAGANVAHGLKRTNADKRCAVDIALRVKADASDRVIAEHCHVSHDLVAEVRRELAESPVAVTPAKRKGADGKVRTVPPMPKTPTVASGSRQTHADAMPPVSVPPVPHAKQKASVTLYKDCVGRDIPAYLNAIWESRNAVTAMAQQLKTVRLQIEAGYQAVDRGIMRIDATVMAGIQRAEGELKDAMPYALCPYCHGSDGGCKSCKDGFVGQLQWKTCVPDDVKKRVTK